MARPRKQGLDYFSHDVDAVSDEKIEVMRALYHNDGYAFYFITLERIYRTDNGELDIGSEAKRVTLAGKIGVSIDRLSCMIKTAFEIGLFDSETYEKKGSLTSSGVKKRLSSVVSERARKRANKGYSDDTEGYSTIFSGENTGYSNNNSGENTGITAERKEKESKVKESKGIIVPNGTQIPKNDSSDEESPQLQPTPYQDILNLYHQNCHSFPKLLVLSKSRKDKIHRRWLEHPDIREWQKVFSRIEASSFCKGNNRNNWKATLDWLIDNDKNMLKVMEGNYDDKTEAKEVIIPVNTSILRMRG